MKHGSFACKQVFVSYRRMPLMLHSVARRRFTMAHTDDESIFVVEEDEISTILYEYVRIDHNSSEHSKMNIQENKHNTRHPNSVSHDRYTNGTKIDRLVAFNSPF